MLEQKRREFQAETGDPLEPVVLGEILGAAIDEDTMSRIEDAGQINIRDYEKSTSTSISATPSLQAGPPARPGLQGHRQGPT